jgi:Na+-transporting NADH:ubiquinone oxidoreductase subunit NqrB
VPRRTRNRTLTRTALVVGVLAVLVYRKSIPSWAWTLVVAVIVVAVVYIGLGWVGRGRRR